MNFKRAHIARIYLFLIFLFLYAPIIYLIIYSFNSTGTLHSFEHFTWDWYKEVFQDMDLWIIVLNTIMLALFSSIISVVIGTFGALGINYLKQKSIQNATLTMNNVLIVSPDVIIGASLLILFTFAGIKLGFVSVLLSHIAFSVPIVVLMVLPKLQEMSPTLIDAAQDLGANTWQTLAQVILPVIRPGIFAGFFMAFTYSLDDFAVSFFVTGNGFSTLSVEIYSRARQGLSPSINSLTTLIFLLTIVLVFGYYGLSTQKDKKTREVKIS